MTHLDPGNENKEGNGGVEGHLPVSHVGEIGERLRCLQQFVQHVVDCSCAVEIKNHAEEGQEDCDDIKDVPEVLEILQTVFLDLSIKHELGRLRLSS